MENSFDKKILFLMGFEINDSILIKNLLKIIEHPDTNVRKSYGILSGVAGIICNVLIFILKLVTGLMITVSQSFPMLLII